MTTPSHARATVSKQIVPHINRKKPVFFGVMPGMGGFDWIARQICKQNKADNVIIWVRSCVVLGLSLIVCSVCRLSRTCPSCAHYRMSMMLMDTHCE